ncbi:MAG TPA: STAS domain-containing protein [Azospirillaceae bacterium]|nr:STAS domain-containing protein [Azospirillaceae bacterium]
MDYSVRPLEGGLEIRLTGRMTLVDHDRFRAVVDSIEKMDGGRCVFDLSGLEFIDSSGLGMFLIARDVAQPKNIDIVLRHAQEAVRRILNIAKFDTLFTVEA